MNVVVLADSHGMVLDAEVVRSKVKVFTWSISGLKWKDTYDRGLCLQSLLERGGVRRSLLDAGAVCLLVGTNSVRILPASVVLSQVEETVLRVREGFPNLRHSSGISVFATFPCVKVTQRYPSDWLLEKNIEGFNEGLRTLSSKLNFTFVDLEIRRAHLASDGMHVDRRCLGFVFDSLVNHFDRLGGPTSAVAPVDDDFVLDVHPEEKMPQSWSRSNDAVKRRNTQRHLKLKSKEQNFMVKVSVFEEWTVPLIKKYLQASKIKFSRMALLDKTTLRLHFRNDEDKQCFLSRLVTDCFDQSHYETFRNEFAINSW